MRIPAELMGRAGLGDPWADWLDGLPRLVDELIGEWELRAQGPVWHGYCSVAIPVRTASGQAAVLKVALPDEESEPEAVALQRWQGRGAVRLLRADPGRRALLLERLSRTDLTDYWDQQACEIVAGLYPVLHVPVMPQLPSQRARVRRWAEALRADARSVPVPRRMVDQALTLARDLTAAPDRSVIHGDLHYANVLLDSRDGVERWLAIDPKPANGDPAYELEPMLRNRFDEYGAGGSVRDDVRLRFHALIDTAGMDEERARDWVIVRSVLNAHWTYQDAVSAGRSMNPAEKTQLTRAITLAKAVQE
ncbi:aminoglycoside phosphotransferase family protein [Nocardioides sp. Bht2]|uniref:aminoglycoside phosphotransferase family protein n=1 Tax=Nocardioides sp. Bht2 TaxID=3392297 RepID=UPI0039B471FE